MANPFRRRLVGGVLQAMAIAAGIGLSSPEVALADTIDHARRYAECMALARRNPEEAFEAATAWAGLGGGDAAQHCAAVALMGLKLYADAAARFESVAQHTKGEATLKAELLAQAAQAWLLNNSPERARNVLTAALKLRPEDPELLIDRAAALAALTLYGEAVEDLTRAIALDPKRADSFAFRASAYRHLDQFNQAAADADRALALDRNHAAALLERGIIRRLTGDDAGARQDWLAVLRAAPGTPAADAAAANLEKMDVKTIR
jgi:regulator of sirC expression with transglutaminase-like and TPR domain